MTFFDRIKEARQRFKAQARDRANVRCFIYYAVLNISILILYTIFMPKVSLELKPMTSPQSEGSSFAFGVAVAILPLSTLLEEFGFRVLPFTLLKKLVFKNRAGDWLLPTFLIISACWTGLLHQLNIVLSSPQGAMFYFGVQAFGAGCLAWIYAKKGLGASWIIHFSWDLFILGLNLVVLLRT